MTITAITIVLHHSRSLLIWQLELTAGFMIFIFTPNKGANFYLISN